MELLGGETAEHPQHMGYAEVIRDLSGFCTGIVEESEILDGSIIKPGDKIIGIESSGIHSNGFSLIERLLFHHKISLKDTPELLTPTRIYASLVQDLLEDFPILGMAHITGGGIPENLPRCLPKGLTVNVDYNVWTLPKIFSKIMCSGEIPEEEMKKVFNLGIGYCLIVPPEDQVITDIQLRIYGHGLQSWVIGDIIS
jgi:phosphoribosylformylglycinamidine cyclo-ligase